MRPKSGKSRALARVSIPKGGINSYDEFKKVFANHKKLIEEFVVENEALAVSTVENWVEMKAKKTNKQGETNQRHL